MLNAMAQQGILSMLEPLLRKWGINLHDQRRNVQLAKESSLKGCIPEGHSTIDLSSASDTITVELVKYLLPKLWFELLNDARTDAVEYEGVSHLSTSFSTMGNAFTFPLQCLIFASLTRACINASDCKDKDWRVYGDDIIIPSSASLLLLETLRFVGFIPNRSKSYITGFFRESCGGDFIRGEDVRPVYLKEDIDLLHAKHGFFNSLQRKQPGNPVLPFLYESVKRPLIGPAIGPAGGEITHFVCPSWLLRRRGWAKWQPAIQSYTYRYACLIGHSVKRTRKNKQAMYASALLGFYGKRHDIRGTQRFSVGVRFTSTPWIEANVAPLWYNVT